MLRRSSRAALHIDLIEELLASGLSLQAIRYAQAAHVKAIIDDAIVKLAPAMIGSRASLADLKSDA